MPVWFNKICGNCSKKYHGQGRSFCSKNCHKEYQKENGNLGWKQLPPSQKYNRTKIQCIRRGIGICTKDKFLEWYNSNPKICFYCGIPEELWEKLAKDSKISSGKFWITIDRKENSNGYFPENMVFSCMRCNQIKSSHLTSEEMLEVAERYIKPKWQNLIRGEIAEGKDVYYVG